MQNRFLGLLLAVGLLLVAQTAFGQLYDPRGMAMGGVSLNQNTGRLARINPAYRATPPRVPGGPTVVPLPIGIIQVLQDFPELDPSQPDFDALEIINFAANIPWAWQFNKPETLNRDVEISIGQNELMIDLNDAKSIIPSDDVVFGGMNSPFDIAYNMDLGARHGVFHFSFAKPFFQSKVALELDDELRAVLKDAKPVDPNTEYEMRVGAIMQAGWTTGLIYARELGGGATAARPQQDGSDPDWLVNYWEKTQKKPRWWVGAGYKRYFGVGYVAVDAAVSLTTGDPIFGDSLDSLDVDYGGTYTRAWPDKFSSLGGGNSLDLGMVMRWQRWEVGAGVTDLVTDLSWGNTHVDEAFFDEDTGEVVNQKVSEGITSVTTIPRSWLLNTSYLGDSWLFAANLIEESGGFNAAAGGELWPVNFLALRGGLQLDQRKEIQLGWGAGVRIASFGFDVGFKTHMRGLTNERIIEMGVALVLY